jgi:carbonic anhydrase
LALDATALEVESSRKQAEVNAALTKHCFVCCVDLLVIGLMYDVGAENAFLQRLGLPSGAASDKSAAAMVVSGSIDLSVELKAQLEGVFYRYDGSLTTPPCTESVKWFVLQGRQPVSQEQIKACSAETPVNNPPV